MHLLHRSIVHRLQTLRFEGWTIPSIAPCQPCFHFSLSWSFSCVTSIDAATFGKNLSVRQTHRRKKQKTTKKCDEKVQYKWAVLSNDSAHFANAVVFPVL